MSNVARPSVSAPLAFALGALLTLAGCAEEKKTTTSLIDAGVDAGRSSIDPKLAAAVAAAAAATGSAKANAGPGGGPPESGIFAPGAADATHAKGAPPKIEVLDDGREPRSTLKIDPDADAEQKSTIMVGVRLGAQSAMPNIDFALSIKVDKPKADKNKAPDAKEPPPVPAGSRLMLAKVTDATLSAKQPGSMPKEVGDQVKKLKGSQIRFTLAENGAGTGYSVQLAKDADPNLDAPLQAAVEAMSTMTVPLPSKPLGVGAYWITTDRADSFGIDVVRYRVFRVEKIDQGNVTLAIECRHWATDNKISLALGADKTDLSVQQFESQGKGTVVHGSAPFLPGSGDITQSTRAVALIARGNQPPQPVPIQTELTGKLTTEARTAPAKSP